MEEQKTITDKGGTMRLGAWKCDIKPGSLASRVFMAGTKYWSATVTVMSLTVLT